MIFAGWILVWLALAVNVQELVLPAFAILMRCSYVDKQFPKISLLVLAMWVLLTGFTALVPGHGVGDALMLLGRLLLSGLLCLHFVVRLRKSRFRFIPGLRDLWFFGARALAIGQDRLRDIVYWIRVRNRAAGKGRLWSAAKYLLASVVSFLFELLFLKRHLAAVVSARGQHPGTAEWVYSDEAPKAWMFTAAGDVLLLITMLTPIVMGAEYLVPAALRSALSMA